MFTNLYSSVVGGGDGGLSGWGFVSGAIEESFGMGSSVVMGVISRVVFVIWIVGVV